MKKTIASLLLCGVMSVPAFAADSYTVDSGHTYPSFEINHLGFSIQRGRFDKSGGRITLDTSARTGTVEITIDTASINTGHAKRDEHLRSEDFFDVGRFPTMTFKSDKLRFNGDKLVGAEGELTLLGVTRPVTLAVDAFSCGTHPIMKKPVCGANATATIKRSEFGMKTYVPAVGDDVHIAIQVEAFKD